MAIPTSGAITHTHWNSEFAAIQALLDAMYVRDTLDSQTGDWFLPFAFKDLNNASAEGGRSVYFTAVANMTLKQMVVGGSGLTANTLTLTLSPATAEDPSDYAVSLASDLLPTNPTVAITTVGTAFQSSEGDFSGDNVRLVKGKLYKAVLTLTSGSTQPRVSASLSFSAEGQRL